MGAAPSRHVVRLEPTPRAPSRARHAVAALLRRSRLAARRDDALLAVSELVAQSVLHERPGEITVRVAVRRGTLRIEVWDAGPGARPRPPRPGLASGSGRGLAAVPRVADRCGVRPVEGGACAWIELDAPGERPRRRAPIARR